MALGGADRALHHRKLGDPRRDHGRRRLDQHGNVEMILQQVARFDRLLVAAVDEENAFAVEAHEGHGGSFLRGCRNERRHLGSGGCRLFRPAGGFADVDERDAAVALFDHLREQRRLLDAADQQRALSRRSGAKLVELGAAQLARGRDGLCATTTLHALGVERHRVFARADKNVWRPIGHYVSVLDGVGERSHARACHRRYRAKGAISITRAGAAKL